MWKDVVGYEDIFAVSEAGAVWSKRTNKILVQGTLKSGYKVITTYIGGRAGTAVCLRVHRMVAEAFLESPSAELVLACSQSVYGKAIVRHKDDNKTNNHFTNLLWGTFQDNSDDYVASGKSKEAQKLNRGSLNVNAALTDAQVLYIKGTYKPKCRVNGARAIARRLNVAHTCVLKVLHGKTYINTKPE